MTDARNHFAPALLSLLALAALPLAHAEAQTVAPRRDALQLSATASEELSHDVLTLAFSTTKEGSDAGQVQAALKQALDAALLEARKIAKPGQVEVRTGNFSLYPRYAPKGGINGWQGSAELIVEGKDRQAISQLSGRIQTLSIARVSQQLSREAREQAEGAVTAQAIAQFRSRASDYARQFGYGGYTIGEVSVSAQDSGMMPMRAPTMRFKAASISADEALPVEAGKATVSVTVSGVVLMSQTNK